MINKKFITGLCIFLFFISSAYAVSTSYETSSVSRIVGNNPNDLINQLDTEELNLNHASYYGQDPLFSKDTFEEKEGAIESLFTDYKIEKNNYWTFHSLAFSEFEPNELFILEAEGDIENNRLTSSHNGGTLKDVEKWKESFSQNYPVTVLDSDYAGLAIPKQSSFVNELTRYSPIIAPNYKGSREFVRAFICNLGNEKTLGNVFREARNKYYENTEPNENELIGITLMSYHLYGNPLTTITTPIYDRNNLEEYCEDLIGEKEDLPFGIQSITEPRIIETINLDYEIQNIGDYQILNLNEGRNKYQTYELITPLIVKHHDLPLNAIVTNLTYEFTNQESLTLNLPEFQYELANRSCYEESFNEYVKTTITYKEDKQTINLYINPIKLTDCTNGNIELFKTISYNIEYFSPSPLYFDDLEHSKKVLPNENFNLDFNIKYVNNNNLTGEIELLQEDTLIYQKELTNKISALRIPLTANSEEGITSYTLRYKEAEDILTETEFEIETRILDYYLEIPTIARGDVDVKLNIYNYKEEIINLKVNGNLLLNDSVLQSNYNEYDLNPGLNTFTYTYNNIEKENLRYTLHYDLGYNNKKATLSDLIISNHKPYALPVGDFYIKELEKVQVHPTIIDPDGDYYNYRVSEPVGIGLEWTPQIGDRGNYSLELSIWDDYGQNTTYNFNIFVSPYNYPPILEDIQDLTIEEGQTAYVYLYATDQDNDNLTYTINNKFNKIDNNLFELQTKIGDVGFYNIEYSAYDGKETTTKQFTLAISPLPTKPYCEETGWYFNNELIINDECNNCTSICKNPNTENEGWYSSCNNILISLNDCNKEVISILIKEISINIEENTNIQDLKIKINGEENLNQFFEGEQKIEFNENNITVLEFDINFDEEILEINNLTIKKQEENSTKGSLIVKGITLPETKTKTVYIDNLDENSKAVCVKDAEISSIEEISEDCNLTSEIYVLCNGLDYNNYKCEKIENKYKITGLKHSGVLETDLTLDLDGDGYFSYEDCNDSNNQIYPTQIESCNNLDDNCDGNIDEDLTKSISCGTGSCSNTATQTCSAGNWEGTCAPLSPSTEICDSLDNNCDGNVDEDLTRITGDTNAGVCEYGLETCNAGTWTETLAPINPSTEICDSLDNNCDGNVDEELTRTIGDTNAGVCEYGLETCNAGTYITILEPILPTTELCDNLDNDCDGNIDEELIRQLGTTDVGECTLGTETCQAGTYITTLEPILPTTELCDNLDNDCDNSVDEIFNLNEVCAVGIGACQKTGTYVCTSDKSTTVCNAIALTASVETCNNIDDNCDGTTDEDLTRITGDSNTGICEYGTETCNAGTWTETLAPINPSTEICDNLDNDCDGNIDESLTNTISCGTGSCSNTATQTCNAGTWTGTCTPKSPSTEVCNNIDDNCDGNIDESLTNTISCGTGSCSNTATQTCNAGTWTGTCTPKSPSTEICDNLDNDCDGNIDEDLTKSISCGTGSCSNTATQTCNAGTWTGTCTPKSPSTEVCNNIDDNCDGNIDESLTNTISCGTGSCSNTATQTCNAGTWTGTCTPKSPSTEICDNLDNDCDGNIDEDYNVGKSCSKGVGECLDEGTYVCTSNGKNTYCNAVEKEPTNEYCSWSDKDYNNKDCGELLCNNGCGDESTKDNQICDGDKDKIPDTEDDCQNTKEDIVDSEGCSCEQKTCKDNDLLTKDNCNTETANCEFPLFGDFDNNNCIDFDDFFLFADNFGTQNPEFNSDHENKNVDFDDFFIFADNFGKNCVIAKRISSDYMEYLNEAK